MKKEGSLNGSDLFEMKGSGDKDLKSSASGVDVEYTTEEYVPDFFQVEEKNIVPQNIDIQKYIYDIQEPTKENFTLE